MWCADLLTRKTTHPPIFRNPEISTNQRNSKQECCTLINAPKLDAKFDKPELEYAGEIIAEHPKVLCQGWTAYNIGSTKKQLSSCKSFRGQDSAILESLIKIEPKERDNQTDESCICSVSHHLAGKNQTASQVPCPGSVQWGQCVHTALNMDL